MTEATTTQRTSYPSNLTDAQWAFIEPEVTRKAGGAGRPTRVDLREVINALLYMNRTGCQWRLLPSDFPKPGAVRYYFDKWTEDGTLVRINDLLRKKVRSTLERDPEPSIGVLDSQSVKTTEAGGDRGFDGGKKSQRAQTAYLG
jgi:putative transposase